MQLDSEKWCNVASTSKRLFLRRAYAAPNLTLKTGVPDHKS